MLTHKNKQPFYRVDQVYALTLNPSNQFYGTTHTCFNKMKKLKEYIYKLFERYNDSIHYELVMDVSEPRELKGGQKPRLHLHGIVIFRTKRGIMNWLLSIQDTLSDRFYAEIDTLGPSVEDAENWYNYMYKYYNIAASMLPLPLVQSGVDLLTILKRRVKIKNKEKLILEEEPLEVKQRKENESETSK